MTGKYASADEKTVLFLGRMTFQKGPEGFVQAARIVVERFSRVRFVMAGAGDLLRKIIETAADLRIGKYFHYTGFLDQGDVQRLYRMSDLYVMPSVSEPFGLTTLEAVRAGLPVIVSKQSGVREVIASCVAVDFWDIEKLADEMLRILENEAYAARLVSSTRNDLARITWGSSAAKVESVYEEVTGPKALAARR